MGSEGEGDLMFLRKKSQDLELRNKKMVQPTQI